MKPMRMLYNVINLALC